MLRVLRVLGIIFFAGLIAWSAYSIRSMYRSGELFEDYSTAGRGHVALLVFSALGFSGLGYLEIILSAKTAKRFGQRRPVTNSDDEDEGIDTANIYSAPKSIDDWASKQRKTKPKRATTLVEFSKVWLGILKFSGFILPLVYSGLLIEQWAVSDGQIAVDWLIRGYLIWMIVCSTCSVFGILDSRRWGQVCGYLLSISNLLMFPYGIGVGLILIVLLMGAGPEFNKASIERKKKRRRKHSSRRQMNNRAVI